MIIGVGDREPVLRHPHLPRRVLQYILEQVSSAHGNMRNSFEPWWYTTSYFRISKNDDGTSTLFLLMLPAGTLQMVHEHVHHISNIELYETDYWRQREEGGNKINYFDLVGFRDLSSFALDIRYLVASGRFNYILCDSN
jgi:hypothetical protein